MPHNAKPFEKAKKEAFDSLQKEIDVARDRAGARASKPISQHDLAHAAGIAIGHANTLVNSKKLQKTLRGGSMTKAQGWAIRLAQVALTLKEDTDEGDSEAKTWLGYFMTAVGMSLEMGIEDILGRARTRRELALRRHTGELPRIRKEIERDGRATVSVYLLTAGRNHDQAQRVFYNRLARLLCGAVSPDIRVDVVPSNRFNNFNQIMAGLIGSAGQPASYSILIGPWSMVSRSLYEARFTKLPFFWHRLACLTSASSPLTWAQVRSAPGRKAGNPARIVTVEGEAGDVYLRSFCRYTIKEGGTQFQFNLIRVPENDPEAITQKFEEMIQAHQESSDREGPPVLVIGEYEARSVKSYFNARNPQYPLKDLAAKPSAFAPRYPLAIATDEKDAHWSETIARCIEEIFVNAPALVVEAYGEYLDTVLRETLILCKESGDPTINLYQDAANSIFKENEHDIPGYLRLYPDDSVASQAFREGLERDLKLRLRQTVEDLKFHLEGASPPNRDAPEADDEEETEEEKQAWRDRRFEQTVNVLINKMVPWLRQQNKFEEIENSLHQILQQIQQHFPPAGKPPGSRATYLPDVD